MAVRIPDFQNPLWSKDVSGLYVDIFANIDPRDNEFYERAVNNIFTLRRTKSDATATQCRGMGNDAFAEERYRMALEKYNEALCYSENGSPQKAFYYSNRAACFLALELYEECLNDIEIIQRSGYPLELKEILDRRKTQCLRHLDKEGFVRIDTQRARLSFKGKEHPQYAGVSECLRLDWSTKWGHHVTTTRSLKVNKTVMIERPFAFAGHGCNEQKYYRCSHCYRALMNLIPCPECVSAMFCDEKCLAAAKESRHRYECRLPKMAAANCDCKEKHFELVLDFLWKVNLAFDTVEDLIETIESNIHNRGSNPNRARHRNDDTKKRIEAILKLATNTEKMRESDFLELLLPCSLKNYKFVMRMPEFHQRFVTDAHRRFLKHFILHLVHLAKVSTSFFDLNFEVRKYHQANPRDSAVGLYPFGTFLNHSCMPNVFVYCVDNRLICKVIRPIEKGEQLFQSYICGELIINDNLNDVAVRAAYNFLESEFRFGIRTCKCIICELRRAGRTFIDRRTESRDANCDKIKRVMDSDISYFFLLDIEERERLEDRAVAYLKKFASIDPTDDKYIVQTFLQNYWLITTMAE